MRKLISSAILIALFTFSASADEGMWLPSLISGRIADMQAKGFHLSAEDIYSVNQASLKDAVLLFGSGCTGEMISPEGLLLTNHHCGYSQIQRHSSLEHDYLKDGFWAMDRAGELPCPELTVSFLERMEDVSAAVLKGWDPAMNEAQRDSVVKANSAVITADATSGASWLKARVEPLYYGNQYYLFVYRVYSDVRFVGAPPSSIGKFGGDTDNWMWPRHTGDFSIFRIYADADNNPADFSESNVPYKPRKYFTISRKGVKEGDFTFIYGNPGSTKEYIISEEARWIGEVSDPEKIAIRQLKLDIMKRHMAMSQDVRIRYSSKCATLANAWKKWQGESLGIKRMKAVEEKKAYEAQFCKWASATQYETVVGRLDSLYKLFEPYDFAHAFYTECAYPVEISQFAQSVVKALPDTSKSVRKIAAAFFKNYYLPIDKECFIAVMERFGERMPSESVPACYSDAIARYGSVKAWADDIFGNSVFIDKDKVSSLDAADIAALERDPAYIFGKEFAQWYRSSILPGYSSLRAEINLLYRDYMRGRMMMGQDADFYPDANLTLRVAYGNVKGYSPSDGIYYHPYTTLKGIMEKDNPDIFDYNIPQTLRDLYAAGDYPDVPVCFLATNHTTGGNSGSPVINADGELIGINFDRVWEGTMSDIVFDPDYCRNISVDIRYILFIIEKIGGASRLLDEMSFRND